MTEVSYRDGVASVESDACVAYGKDGAYLELVLEHSLRPLIHFLLLGSYRNSFFVILKFVIVMMR